MKATRWDARRRDAWRWQARRAWEKVGPRMRPVPRSDPRTETSLRAVESSLVWIFGSPRSGSTWLLRLLSAHRDVVGLNETGLPAHLVPRGMAAPDGEYFSHGQRAGDPNYFFARRYLPALQADLRPLVLRQLERQAVQLRGHRRGQRWIVIKEPNGSHAADTVFSLLPAARLVFLVRDGRDVVDSVRDARLGEDTWLRGWKAGRGLPNARQRGAPAQRDREQFIRGSARRWVHLTEAVQRAAAALLPERRLLVRYEDLQADTVAALQSVNAWLGVESSLRELQATVAREAFEAVPENRRGEGRFYRAATPGLWRERFSASEQEILQEEMGAKLRELGYD